MSRMRPMKVLTPFSWLYGGAVTARNLFYDKDLFRVHRVKVPVISVGNLTAGGTGKTPLVGEIVRRLQGMNRRVGVISRGYGRRSQGPLIVSGRGSEIAPAGAGGDEAVMIAKQYPGLVVVVAEQRFAAAEIAVRELGADVLVMDDGYQHRALDRDLNILVVDGRMDLQRERLLPAGLRREPLSALRRAQLIAVGKIGSPGEVSTVSGRLERWTNAPVFAFRTRVTGIVDFRTGLNRELSPGTRAFVLSGIGDHAGFLATVRSAGADVVADHDFGDHHRFTVEEVTTAITTARQKGCAMVVTTEKDAVRLGAGKLGEHMNRNEFPFVVFRIRAEVFVGEEQLNQSILRILEKGDAVC
ncbi:MAG: tetraacyldisaccharide 4'-kinase [Bacteroidota bacterium]